MSDATERAAESETAEQSQCESDLSGDSLREFGDKVGRTDIGSIRASAINAYALAFTTAVEATVREAVTR